MQFSPASKAPATGSRIESTLPQACLPAIPGNHALTLFLMHQAAGQELNLSSAVLGTSGAGILS